MFTIFGVPGPLLFGQLLLGFMNGAVYAMLALGLAVIFGMLHIVNFCHGALFMLGGFVAWGLLETLGIGFWWALIIAPLAVGLLGWVLERSMISRLYGRDPIEGLLLTFGIAFVIEGIFRNYFGVSGIPYPAPAALQGATNLGFMVLPHYRALAVGVGLAACLLVWLAIEKTALGARLRAATENASLVEAFGINVPMTVSLTYAAGAGLAAFAGVLSAPIYAVSPAIGATFLVTVFAVVVIGGMGSIMGAIVAGIAIGILEAITKVFYPPASSTIPFLCMVIVLMVRPTGLFGKVE